MYWGNRRLYEPNPYKQNTWTFCDIKGGMQRRQYNLIEFFMGLFFYDRKIFFVLHFINLFKVL